MNAQRGLETRKARKPGEILATLGLVAVFLALWYWWFLSPRMARLAALRSASWPVVFNTIDSHDVSAWEPAPQIYAADGSGRAVFPYSVIPGGVHSSSELADAVQSDPEVAKHYRGFRLRATHVIRLKKDR